MSKREASRRIDAMIATMQRLSREGGDAAYIARAMRCREEVVRAVLKSYPLGEGNR